MIQKAESHNQVQIKTNLDKKQPPKTQEKKTSTAKKAAIATVCVTAALALAYFVKRKGFTPPKINVPGGIQTSRNSANIPKIVFTPPKKPSITKTEFINDLRKVAVDAEIV